MAANPVDIANAPSTWDTIRNGAIDGANWIGRQVQWLGSTIKDYAFKVFEWAKPFFQAIGKFCVERFEQVKELIANNKETSIILLAGVAITAVTVLAARHICCGDEAKKEEDGTKLYA